MVEKIFIARHGQTEWSKSGRHTSTTDLSLTLDGEMQAEQLADRLRRESFSQIFCSPLKRALQTADALGEKYTIEEDLQEWNYGEYEGLTTEQIRKASPHWNIFDYPTPGGESAQQVQERAKRFLQKIAKCEGNILLFSHGHFSRALAATWIGAHPSFGKHLQLATASLSILFREHLQPTIFLWNSPS